MEDFPGHFRISEILPEFPPGTLPGITVKTLFVRSFFRDFPSRDCSRFSAGDSSGVQELFFFGNHPTVSSGVYSVVHEFLFCKIYLGVSHCGSPDISSRDSDVIYFEVCIKIPPINLSVFYMFY